MKNFSTKKIIFLILVLSSLAGNIYFLSREYRYLRPSSEVLTNGIATRPQQRKIISFFKLFVEKILANENEVSFEDRLLLENSVRGLNDPQILNVWQMFVNSQTDIEAQKNTVSLFKLMLLRMGG